MPIALTTDPTYPVPGDKIALDATGETGNFQRYELTSAPSDSALAAGFLVDAAGDDVAVFMPDVPGAYGFNVYDYDKYDGGFARYLGDPLGEARMVLLSATSVTLSVGALMDLPIVTPLGSATLRLTILGSNVRAASIVDVTTEAARVAAIDATVATKLAALEGVAVTSLDDDLATAANELATEYTAHIATGGIGLVHASADTTNVLAREPSNSNADAILRVNDIHDKLIAHMQAGSSGGTWHGTDDGKNVPITAKSATLAGAYVHAVDLRFRVYEQHRVQIANPASHLSADNTNALAPAPPLADAVTAFLNAVATTTQTAPDGEQQGAIDAAHLFGFSPP